MKRLIIFSMFILMVIFTAKALGINLYKDRSLVFVILTHCRNEQDDAMWRYSYNSIKRFHPRAQVVVIDDNSPYPISDNYINIIRSEFPGAGEILPYYYFLKYQWAAKMIVLHDSMFLKRSLKKNELSNRVKFHWDFDHFCDENGVINELLSDLAYADELIDYNMNRKSEWWGCFGAASMIDLDVLKQIEDKYGFTTHLVKKITTRSHRMALERAYAVLLFKEGYLTLDTCSNYGSIHYFPGHFGLSFEDPELASVIVSYPGAIIKTWRGR